MIFARYIFFAKSKKITYRQEIEKLLSIKPKNIEIYLLAFQRKDRTHTAINSNNERLEYLGDAILGAVVADYLFKRYPTKGDGFLTDMRSKIVNRQMLHAVALKIGFKHLSFYTNEERHINNNSRILGNVLEAVIGAIYVDRGYRVAQHWILKHLLMHNISIEALEVLDINVKNKLIGWTNRTGKVLSFNVEKEIIYKNTHEFFIAAVIDGENIATGHAYNKKEACEIAAKKAVATLGIS